MDGCLISRFNASFGRVRFCAMGMLLLMIIPSLSMARSDDPSTSGGAAMVAPSGGGRARDGGNICVDLNMHLPFPAGKKYEVIQGNYGEYTHDGFNRFAWDFGMPEGSEVCAVAAGQVVQVKQDSTKGGASPEYLNDGNNVIIDHGAGIFTQYLHLKAHSVIVQEGQMVSAGQVIAHSGNTGFSSTPHLHFQVQNEMGQSLPSRFEDVPGDGIPREDMKVLSQNNGKDAGDYLGVSLFEGREFERNGIEDLKSNMPSHLVALNRIYNFSGIARHCKGRVAVYLMKPTGGKAIFSTLGTVNSDGEFHVSFNFADVPTLVSDWSTTRSQSNRFCIAIAPVTSDGSFWSDVSVPICLR